jgi:hypothetical protein
VVVTEPKVEEPIPTATQSVLVAHDTEESPSCSEFCHVTPPSLLVMDASPSSIATQ